MRVLIETPTDGLEKLFSKEGGFTPILSVDYNNLPPEDDVDIVVFSGGADVNPLIYGATPHPKTRHDNERDKNSLILYNKYLDKIKIGVCRGAQFLCAVSGGKLYQDIAGHTSCRHKIYTSADTPYTVLGDHHQACAIMPPDFTVTAEAEDGITEAFYSVERKTLGVQFHPEWGDKETEECFWMLYNEFIAYSANEIFKPAIAGEV